ncbi:hypothetical protein JW905_00655 [bacterium]|nr:hypothetical protein [candidate division CSSED10-310 bacterium]
MRFHIDIRFSSFLLLFVPLVAGMLIPAMPAAAQADDAPAAAAPADDEFLDTGSLNEESMEFEPISEEEQEQMKEEEAEETNLGGTTSEEAMPGQESGGVAGIRLKNKDVPLVAWLPSIIMGLCILSFAVYLITTQVQYFKKVRSIEPWRPSEIARRTKIK